MARAPVGNIGGVGVNESVIDSALNIATKKLGELIRRNGSIAHFSCQSQMRARLSERLGKITPTMRFNPLILA